MSDYTFASTFFDTEFNEVVNWTVNNVGAEAIVPGTVLITIDVNSYHDVTGNNNHNGEIINVDDNTGLFVNPLNRRVHYGAGVLRFAYAYLPEKGSSVTFNFDTVALTAHADLSLPNGTITTPGAAPIKPGSVRFIATLKTTSKVVSTKSATNDFDTQVTAEVEEFTQVVVYDVPSATVPGVGNLYFLIPQGDPQHDVGTVDYGTGEVTLTFDTAYRVPNVAPSFLTRFGPDFALTRTLSDGTIVNKLLTWDYLKWDAFQRSQGSIVAQQKYTLLHSQTGTGVKYALASAPTTTKTHSVTVNAIPLVIPVQAGGTLNEVTFTLDGTRYVTQDTNVVTNPDPATGVGTTVGSVEPSTGVVTLTTWPKDVAQTLDNVTVAVAPPANSTTCNKITIRTASAPLRPGSFSVSWTSPNPNPVGADTSHTATADLDGYINTPYVIGIIDYARGVVQLWFTTNYIRPIGGDLPLSDFSSLGIPGVTTRKSWMAYTVSLRYNTVAYSYLPLDATLLGIEPVRLPSDGRVPIFRPGGFVVVGHTGEITATVSNTQVIDCARVRLSRVRVIGDDGAVINTGYTADLEAGTVTFTDVSGYSQPVTIQHRIEDMMMASDVQINGQLTFTRALTHDYPLGSYVSSALIAGGNGDMFARVSVLFDQATWNGAYADVVSGSSATGTFNSAQYPIAVTNRGARTERWVVQFTSGTTFNVIGENVGVIATGSVNSNCLPINPATNVPYFTIPALGWGAGWSAGNVLRFNTVGAEFPVWVVRTVQQGPETVPNDSFTILIRGDVNA